MEKILTIVIPTYNMEKYLDKCLSSLIVDDEELMDRLEVLVVIDGAKDRSSEIAHKYEEKYPKTFIVIDKENGNYGSCINRGLKEAKGKYIKVLDADDYFENKSFKEYLDQLVRIKYTVDVIFSGYCTVNEDGEYGTQYIRNIQKEQILDFSSVQNSVTEGQHIAMHEIAYRTELLRKQGYKQLEGISYTDQEWILYPMVEVKKIYCIDKVIYFYLVGRSGQTMDPVILTKSVPTLIKISNRMIKWYSEYNSERLTNEVYIRSNIIWHLNHLYSTCLLSNKKGIELELLAKFDNYLFSTNIDLYNELNNLKARLFYKTVIHYVKIWRNHRNKKRIPWILKIRNKNL